MTEYTFSWDARVQRSVTIEANSKEEAHKKWVEGDYEDIETDDEDIIGRSVDIDGESYDLYEFEEYK